MPGHIPDEQGEFAGRIALVTGAGQGIGEAVAHALATLGARVAATDRSPDGVAALAESWAKERAASGASGTITAYELDVADGAAVEATVETVERELGPVDTLVNVAGILRTAEAVELTDQDWADTFAVNTTGVFHTSRAVAARMAARRSGCIVTVGSNAAGVPRTGMAAYAASKAAATMFTKCLGLELARSGVRCNVVAPGSTDTPMQRQLWTGPQSSRRVVDGDPASYRTGIPLGRLAQPQDIADAVVFLASDRARHITMQDLYVDGGATLR
ncbi:2,3-dihydro-2,3-dihydroxybenzoate dehydrogenase [Streptomyces sp. SAJ15]|uniref:2,3-dihydro-2,3-dihydroxybenzoate dehydrogenase n=1 Tax=Streptomyces sp. SAJ15 TaxID=2011095 RepID=UPI00118622DF|nr:2,3-dihydro-2,3-dihydroxybenzoate dehydrogenase [Streptomyces sp. SAJ15]TVL89694.1 2,3-dihydro-2,3-dihydroxybenzoate dehydrogenase [Streptomyces sp. SAJ15]